MQWLTARVSRQVVFLLLKKMEMEIRQCRPIRFRNDLRDSPLPHTSSGVGVGSSPANSATVDPQKEGSLTTLSTGHSVAERAAIVHRLVSIVGVAAQLHHAI